MRKLKLDNYEYYMVLIESILNLYQKQTLRDKQGAREEK
jgi:hypothetical protein